MMNSTSAILDGRSVDPILERNPASQLQLDQRRRCLRGVDSGGTNELVRCERALLEPSIERLRNRPDRHRFPGDGDDVEELGTSSARVTGAAPSLSSAFVPPESELVL